MIYNENPALDYDNILQYINEFTKGLGIQDVQVKTSDLVQVCSSIRNQFPHADGIEKASVFKKVANFVAYFIKIGPIKSNVSATAGAVGGYSNINAVVAFDIALVCLQNSAIKQKDGSQKTVNNLIYISDHSYFDIIEALSSSDICPDRHYQLLAVFFEQLIYKTNRHCEYRPAPTKDSYYGQAYPVTGGDDMVGV